MTGGSVRAPTIAASNASRSCSIDAWTSFDAQYSLDTAVLLDNENGPVLTFGVINLTGEDPPQVFTNGGFDSKVHDPRGRMFYVRAKVAF